MARHYDFLPGMLRPRRSQAEVDAYVEGVADGLYAFSWWKDGVQYLGTCGQTLRGEVAKLNKDRVNHPAHLCGERSHR